MTRAILGVPRDELRTALLWVWMILSAITGAATIAPFVADRHLLDRLTPVCVWKSTLGRECPGCGLTRSFQRIADFDWAGAAEFHRAGPPLFTLFLLNAAGCLVYGLRRLIRRFT